MQMASVFSWLNSNDKSSKLPTGRFAGLKVKKYP